MNTIVKEDSTFIPEGKNMLIEEFGKEYANYFTILSSIARGENTRAKIEAIVHREIGGYLTNLEHDYGLISKVTPIFVKVETKALKYWSYISGHSVLSKCTIPVSVAIGIKKVKPKSIWWRSMNWIKQPTSLK